MALSWADAGFVLEASALPSDTVPITPVTQLEAGALVEGATCAECVVTRG